MEKSRYKRNKELGELYRSLNETMSFTQFKQLMGIKCGRPKKPKKD